MQWKKDSLFNKWCLGSSHYGAAEMNLTSIHEDACSIPGLAQMYATTGVVTGCGTGHRCGLELVLLWLLCQMAAAALIPHLAWDLPYVACVP